MNKIANSSGFTLIEIMIAMFVLAIGLLGAAGVATTIISGNTLGKEITTATTLAQDKMEELKGTTYLSIAPGSDTQESIYTRTWTVTSDSPVTGMKTIDIVVAFSWKGSPHNVTLQTMVGQ